VSTKTRSGPIWGQPAPGSRKPRFTRDQIAEIAIRIADEEGFEAVSMRRISEELDAGVMTLYHYVRTKEDLIALMDDAIMAEILVPPEALSRDWQASLATLARASYRAFLRHPWALHALSGARFGPNGMRHAEQSVAAVRHAPFDDEGKMDALDIVDEYVFGHVFRAAELAKHSEFAGGKPSAELIAFTREQMATGDYPNLVWLFGDDFEAAWTQFTARSGEARFERGLAAVLDGLRRTMPRARVRGQPRGRGRRRPR
jgi:AcrR family transcriptional regulator